ncbi:hypothetical protein AAU61_07255 [Desulfocarbo indianensis]|nr:hypothetical protein AAU61_07255 [Desulfocarbo indianensis]
MSGNDSFQTLRTGERPPCLRAGYRICRGCSGWRAMLRACRPGGAWQGSVIHCPCTGLTLRSRLAAGS